MASMEVDSAGTLSLRVEGTPGEHGELGTTLGGRALPAPVLDTLAGGSGLLLPCVETDS